MGTGFFVRGESSIIKLQFVKGGTDKSFEIFLGLPGAFLIKSGFFTRLTKNYQYIDIYFEKIITAIIFIPNFFSGRFWF